MDGLLEDAKGETLAEGGGKKIAVPKLPKLSVDKNWIYPLLIALPFVILEFAVISQYHQLPGPLYGGDIYWHYGETLGIYEGRAPWTNPQIPGEFAYYPWLPQTLIAWFGHLIGNIFWAYLYFALVETILFSYAAYFLGRTLFGTWKMGAFFAAVWVGGNILFQSSIGSFGGAFAMPLFLAFLYRSFSYGGIKNKILAGVFMGIASLSHVSYLPATFVMLAIVFAYEAWLKNWRISMHSGHLGVKLGRTNVRAALKLVLPIFVVGFAIALAFWAPPLFVYKMNTPNAVNEFANPDFGRHGLSVAYELAVEPFFSTSSIAGGNVHGFVFSLLLLAGLYLALKGKEHTVRFALLLVVATLIAGLHYFVSLPLFGKAIIPLYLYGALSTSMIYVLFALAIYTIVMLVKSGRTQVAVAIVLVAFALFPAVRGFDTSGNQWVNVAKQGDFAFTEMSQWIRDNTNIDDTFLSHEELSFAVNAITARKVVTSRRTHFSPYLDINQRTADAAVILYGNSAAKTKELLEKYGVDYVYWDSNWLDFAGREPLLTDVKYEDYLSQHGVTFSRVNTYLDPAFQPRYPKYDMLSVAVARNDRAQPWSEEFGKHIRPVKNFDIGGQSFAAVYVVDYGTF